MRAGPAFAKGWRLSAAAALMLLAAGCGHKTHNTQQSRQTAPPVSQYPPGDSGPVGVAANSNVPRNVTPALNTKPPAKIAPTPAPAGGIDDEDRDYINTHQPIYSEEGLATWYSAPYKGRKAANGQVFDDNALTAAHRTLPFACR